MNVFIYTAWTGRHGLFTYSWVPNSSLSPLPVILTQILRGFPLSPDKF